jgi:hypothetical protein
MQLEYLVGIVLASGWTAKKHPTYHVFAFDEFVEMNESRWTRFKIVMLGYPPLEAPSLGWLGSPDLHQSAMRGAGYSPISARADSDVVGSVFRFKIDASPITEVELQAGQKAEQLPISAQSQQRKAFDNGMWTASLTVMVILLLQGGVSWVRNEHK